MKQHHSFNRISVFLILASLAVNIAFSKFALLFDIPLYLDSIGTIIAAVLGGYLSGIIVGFFSNVFNGISDPITLYYGIISIIIAVAASFLASKKWFSKFSFSRIILLAFIFSVIGGGLGSVLTWLLYGFSFGSGISAPFAILLHESFISSEFYAQLTADFLIDIIDKLITVLICFLSIRVIPISLMSGFPNSHLYYELRHQEKPVSHHNVRSLHPAEGSVSFRKHSLRSEVVMLITVSAIILGCLATTISYTLYRTTMSEHYVSTASSVVDMASDIVTPDRINEYLESASEGSEYLKEEYMLKNLRDSIPEIEYIYVYQIREDGCHVVFDVDTPELSGEDTGTIIPIESTFLPYKDALLAGEEIPPIISNDSYGWLLTVYKPLFDSEGRCVAYAAADISMDDVRTDRAIFIIKMISLLFGASIIIIAFTLWFAERRIIIPINAMTKAADEFAYDCEEERLETTARLQALNISTGDEIESLYGALKKTVTDVSQYISDIKTKSDIISQMQNNIIISFANMVENRDTNTGQHVKHTAAYVNAIALSLIRKGKYIDILNQDYVDGIVRSAPLHDLGKIKISDTILNKPGKLTAEEFEQIKIHTTAGKEILEGVVGNVYDTGYLSEAVNMASYHHERWDGTGYPEGLRGTEIPLSARIMAVADVYDALISKRSYKEPMSYNEAFEVICRESGTHFDPDVVDAFMAAREAIVEATK